MTRLCVIVPTRGRPNNAARLRRAVDEAHHADFVFAIDSNDPQAHAYLASDGWFFQVPGHPTMVEKLNIAASDVLSECDYEYLGFMGDDHLPRTDNWDGRVLEALDALPGPGIVYCNDLFQGPTIPTAVFMHAEIVRALGWMALPTVEHLYCDNAWKDLGEALGAMSYLGDVVIEHLHPHAGKADDDRQYERVNSPERHVNDRAAWERWRTNQLASDVALIQSAHATC